MRSERFRYACIALAFTSAIGCADATREDPLPAPGDAIVRFDPMDGPMPMGAVPWPSDLYRDTDGNIALGEIPNPQSDGPMLTATRELLARRDGFCTTCNAVFVIEGGLQTDSLPAADAEPALDDAVVLVDVDPASPERGRMFPLRWQWDQSSGWLSVRPVRGFALMGARRYAFVVTDTARGGDGLPVGPAPTFEAIRDGYDGTKPRLAAAAEMIDPTLVELEDLGLSRAHVRGLAAFTTEDPTADLRAIRSVLHDGPPATAHVDHVYAGDALDELLGIPQADRPGIDVPPAAGVEGSASIRHATTALVVRGRFSAPRFVEGTGTEIGATARDDAGLPVVAQYEDVPFVLVVPGGVDVSRLPVVVAHHGFNASRVTGFVLADTAGRAGFAVLAIDAYQHGDRAASATDDEHALRGGIAGPDGFAETVPLDVSARVFGLAGADADLTLYPGYPLGAFEQFAADAMSAVRLLRDGDVTALRNADPLLADLAFDSERIAFVGNSMGAVVGTAIVALEPDVHAAVLDVMPGSIIETLAESGEFRTLSENLLLPRVGVTETFDEVDRAMVFDPTVDLFRWVLEPIDPLALAPYMVRNRIVGPPPHLVVQLAGHDEVAAPPASESVLCAAGIPARGDLRFAPIDAIDLPIESEPSTPAIAARRWPNAMHGMLEVSAQTSHFEQPLDVPLMPSDPVPRTNPIEAVHAQIETFLSTYAHGGPVLIIE